MKVDRRCKVSWEFSVILLNYLMHVNQHCGKTIEMAMELSDCEEAVGWLVDRPIVEEVDWWGVWLKRWLIDKMIDWWMADWWVGWLMRWLTDKMFNWRDSRLMKWLSGTACGMNWIWQCTVSQKPSGNMKE